MAEDQKQLLHLNEMLAEKDIAARLRILARTLRDLGWGHVILSVQSDPDEKLTIAEPVQDELMRAHVAAERLFREDNTNSLEKFRMGPGYVLPREEPVVQGGTGSASAGPADWLLVPIRMRDGQLAGMISLSEPSKPHLAKEQAQALNLVVSEFSLIIENDQLQHSLEANRQASQNQIEDLFMLQRVDEELSATLNFDNVMMLTMDWALRRTGATAGMLSMVTNDDAALIPLSALGYPPEVIRYDVPIPLTRGIAGRAARTREIQIVKGVQQDPDYMPLLAKTKAEIAVPLVMRGRLLGVLSLESDEVDTFDTIDLPFIRRLASRAAVALDNARLYRETEQRADEMAALYSASRVISSSIERGEALINAAQALAAVLSVSGIIVADYQPDKNCLSISASYRLGTARGTPDRLPEVGERFELESLPELQDTIRNRRPVSLQLSSLALSRAMRSFLVDRHFKSMLGVPLTVQTEVFGLAILVEGRRERQFSSSEVLMAESLASQVAAALRQAKLYEDVRELEKLKSEMIRMASHDLRNPLGNAMGYLEMLLMAVGNKLTKEQLDYVANIKRSTNIMKSLIEDLLTLERVDSERQQKREDINLSQLVHDVVEAQQLTANLQHQNLTVKTEGMDLWVSGNGTQLRQAMTNLISNAIKYTPSDGRIEVRLRPEGKRLIFEVQDNGYGISKDRQDRLFQRFYRAREPGTDHITGTGLGLSLVKAVIERHGGKVGVQSESGVGSTFSFWLPVIDAPVTVRETA